MADEKKYRTEVPNIIDDLGLDPYERALYTHYKRVCGASGGQCTEGVRTTAKKTKMSFAKAGRIRQALISRGLIVGDVQRGKDSPVAVVDIWDINAAYYADKDRPNVEGWTVKRLRAWLKNCVPHTQSGEDEGIPETPNCVPETQHCVPETQHCVPETQHCVPHTQKKEPIKKEPIKKKESGGNKPPPPPGVEVYRNVTNRFPDKATWEMIAAGVGEAKEDLDFWRLVVIDYIASGFNKTNVKVMLEYFNRRELPATKRGKKGSRQNGQKPNGTSEPGIIEAAQRASGVSGEWPDSPGSGDDTGNVFDPDASAGPGRGAGLLAGY